jgi:hypothetical protein
MVAEWFYKEKKNAERNYQQKKKKQGYRGFLKMKMCYMMGLV